MDGFNLHGRVAFSPAHRPRLQQLVQYCARPPLANDRLRSLPDGKLLLELKTHWRDGTTHLKFEPIELMERLAAQIPKPYVNLVLYAGLLAPNAKLRKQVVAYARPSVHATEGGSSRPQTRAEKETWAALMRATFDLDVLTCSRCGGRMRYIATILDARAARNILEHLGLPARARRRPRRRTRRHSGPRLKMPLMSTKASADFREAAEKYAEAEQRYRWMGYAIMLATALDVSSALCASAQSTRSFRKVAGCGPSEHADHVLAHARGGANHPWNYVCLDASLDTSWRDGLWVKVQHMPLQLLRGAITSGLMKLRCGDSAVAFGR